MDITAALTDEEELVVLSYPDQTMRDASFRLREIRPLPFAGNDADDTMTLFEESLKLKNTIDRVQQQVLEDPTWEWISILLNCEYHLFFLTSKYNTTIRKHPFLPHWVSAVRKLESALSDLPPHGVGSSKEARQLPNSQSAVAARLNMIKYLLQSGSTSGLRQGPQQLAEYTAKSLYNIFADPQHTLDFDIAPYVRILEDEGIYDPPSQTHVATSEPASGPDRAPSSAPPHSSGKAKAETSNTESSNSASSPAPKDQDWKQTLLSQLAHEPNDAVSQLSRLPIELPYLEFLTTLVENGTLQKLSIDPAHVICNYLQHALRLAERMGEQPSSTAEAIDGFHSSSASANGDSDADLAGVDHSRASQVRAVKLILLFIRNLIRKALISPETLYFEIQEICVRYAWIKEAREFRAFIEEGAG